MPKLSRRGAREQTFYLLFESIVQNTLSPEIIYARALEVRDVPEMDYIHSTYFGVMEHLDVIDAKIEAHSNGWRVQRITPASAAALRLSVYEMLYVSDRIPPVVSINEAVELVKTYDDPKMKGFVNGILNAVKAEIEGVVSDGADTSAEHADTAVESEA